MKSNSCGDGFYGINPVTGDRLEPQFADARLRDIDAALSGAAGVADELRGHSGERLQTLMESIADELEAVREEIEELCRLETGYPAERVAGEFGRMVDGMRLFGRVAKEGSWLDVKIDHGDPARQPLPKPDLRRMNMAVGPVVVFGASNFPLALSVAGSDVASALAAGCPVVAKGHPSHPGTSDLLGKAVSAGVAAAGFPEGAFAMVQGASKFVGQALVEHPEVKAVAFTGSLAGGRAIFDLAARREVPVPVYAEMGSVNPQFVFDNLLAEDAAGFAKRLLAAATMGNGQFCTNPGLVFLSGNAEDFISSFRAEVRNYPGAPMLNAGILRAFETGAGKWSGVRGVEILEQVRLSEGAGVAIGTGALVAKISIEDFFESSEIFQEELFGPATLLIECENEGDFICAARRFGGQLGASLHGRDSDLKKTEARELLSLLTGLSGRVLVNGFPTGLEVCDSIQHGGPYPATTDAHWTSVGTAAIERFGRPVAFQDVPESLLPDALKEGNPLGLRRLVDGELHGV